jgi:hypothetical protein
MSEIKNEFPSVIMFNKKNADKKKMFMNTCIEDNKPNNILPLFRIKIYICVLSGKNVLMLIDNDWSSIIDRWLLMTIDVDDR